MHEVLFWQPVKGRFEVKPMAGDLVNFAGYLFSAIGPVPAYRAVIIATPGFSEAVAGGAWGAQWVGLGIKRKAQGPSHAILGTLGASKLLDLNPAGFTWSLAEATDGSQQVGTRSPRSGNPGGALLWRGSARSVVMLNPAGYRFSQALSVSSGRQAGYAQTSAGREHAALWTGTAASFVDLNPVGFISSDVFAMDGKREAGCGMISDNRVHALVWSGTAKSARDINPNGYVWSKAKGIFEDLIVGDAEAIGEKAPHTLLWHDTAGKIIDLNPKGYAASWAVATNGRKEVGWGDRKRGKLPGALVWKGSAASVIDLQKFLPQGMVSSQAFAVTRNGTILGFAVVPAQRREAAVAWIPIRQVKQ